MTKFSEIYNLNSNISKSNEFYNIPEWQKLENQFKDLKFAIGRFKGDCLKDLGNYISYECQAFEEVGNGIDQRFQLPVDFDSNSELSLYVTLESLEQEDDYVEISNNHYSFDINTKIIDFDFIIEKNQKCYIVVYTDGYFIDDLSITEQTILAEYMTIPFQERHILKESKLTQMVDGNKDAQAPHIKALQTALKDFDTGISARAKEYSYQDSPERNLFKQRLLRRY